MSLFKANLFSSLNLTLHTLDFDNRKKWSIYFTLGKVLLAFMQQYKQSFIISCTNYLSNQIEPNLFIRFLCLGF